MIGSLVLWSMLSFPLATAPVAAVRPLPGPEARAVILPARAVGATGKALASVGPALERALADAMARHAPFRVLTRTEVGALLGKAAQEQLTGCDAEGCLAEIADALGTELVVTSQLARAGTLWALQVSLLERVGANALRRGEARARTPEGLLSGIEPLVRELVLGADVALDDPRLADRLATTQEGADALRAEARARPGASLASTWTRLLVARNAPRDVLRLLGGGALLAAAVAFVVTGVATVPLTSTFSEALLANGSGARSRNADGTRDFPVFALALWFLHLPIITVTVGVPLLAAGIIAFMDMRKAGRIPVGKDGCCRDDEQVRAAERPSIARRLAPLLGILGAVLVLTSPLTTFLVILPFSFLTNPGVGPLAGPWAASATARHGPTVPVPDAAYDVLDSTVPLALSGFAFVNMVALGLGIFGGALVLLAHERATLLDDDPPR